MLNISKNEKDTQKIAEDFAKQILKPHNLRGPRKGVSQTLANYEVSRFATVVSLSGDLGTGKTTFTQAVARILGVKRKVNSPTFVIMKRYEIKYPYPASHYLGGGEKRVKKFTQLFHLDAYRLKNAKELLNLGWAEIISNPEHLVFIEWPENVKKAMPKKHHKISIKHLPAGKAGTKEGHRSFKIKSL